MPYYGMGVNGVDRETQLTDRVVPQSAGHGPDEDVLSTLRRYLDRHRWSWNLSMRLINLYYGTHYTEKQLRSLYKARGT